MTFFENSFQSLDARFNEMTSAHQAEVKVLARGIQELMRIETWNCPTWLDAVFITSGQYFLGTARALVNEPARPFEPSFVTTDIYSDEQGFAAPEGLTESLANDFDDAVRLAVLIDAEGRDALGRLGNP